MRLARLLPARRESVLQATVHRRDRAEFAEGRCSSRPPYKSCLNECKINPCISRACAPPFWN